MRSTRARPAGFRAVVSDEFLDDRGALAFGDIGLELLDDDPRIHWEFADVVHSAAVADADAVLVMGTTIDGAWLERAPHVAVIARFGVGVDAIDLDACTARGVAVTTTPGGVRTPVATAALTLVLMLSYRLPAKQALARAGDWRIHRPEMGDGVTGRTLGLLGLGNVGQEIVRLAQPFGMQVIATDPYATPERARELGVALVDLHALCRRSDHLVVSCPLTAQTRHIIGARELALLGPDAYLVNVARGAIVDEAALIAALRNGGLRGAGLDVFETEPLDAGSPLLSLPNVIATPHSLAITSELALGNGTQAIRSILAVARGNRPEHVADPAVLQNKAFLTRLASFVPSTTTEEDGNVIATRG